MLKNKNSNSVLQMLYSYLCMYSSKCKPNESSRAYVIQFWVAVTRQSLQRMTCKFEMEKNYCTDVVCYCCCVLYYSI